MEAQYRDRKFASTTLADHGAWLLTGCIRRDRDDTSYPGYSNEIELMLLKAAAAVADKLTCTITPAAGVQTAVIAAEVAATRVAVNNNGATVASGAFAWFLIKGRGKALAGAAIDAAEPVGTLADGKLDDAATLKPIMSETVATLEDDVLDIVVL